VNERIFLRPTPWRVAFGLGFAFFSRAKTHQFINLPLKYLRPTLEFCREGDQVSVSDDENVIFTTPIEPLSFANAVIYHCESFAYGLFPAFWNWRWSAGTMTNAEVQSKIERLERQVQEFLKKPDDEDGE